MNDFDIVSYNGNKYILRIIEENGTKRYMLYTLNGKLFMDNANKGLLSFVSNYDDFFDKIKNKNNKHESHSSGGSGGGGKSYRSNKANNSKQAKNEDGAKELSDDIGEINKTEQAYKECEAMIMEAKEAISSANVTLNTWDDTKNAEGLATEASIAFLANMIDALGDIENNLKNNKQASNALNRLNISLKKLLIQFAERKKKEKERDLKQAEYDAEPEYITKTDSEGNEIQERNPKKDALKEELDKIKAEIDAINAIIDELQNDIDYQYRVIRDKYGNLVNFGSMFGTRDTIFGTSGIRRHNGSNMPVDMANGYDFRLFNHNGVKYWLYIPEGAEYTPDLPVHIYFRGAGEFGREVSGSGLDALLKRKSSPINPNAIIICPVTNTSVDAGDGSYADKIKSVIDDVVEEYNADSNRVSVSGHSSGGRAAMYMADRYPDYFSAVVPMSDANVHCTGSNCRYWGITGSSDNYALRRLNKCQEELGSDEFNLTIINGEGHDIENFALTNQYEIDGENISPLIWALSQSKA